MKTEIILVRHGETESNRLNLFRGQSDVKLNKNGIKQAEEIGRALKNRNIEALYSSPLKRALDTAKAIGKEHNLKININEGFNNINLGEWQGKSKDYVKEEYPLLWDKWLYDTENLKIPGGETLGDVQKRSLKSLEELIKENKGKTFIIVSHRSVLRILLPAILGIKKHYYWKIYVDNASYSIIEHRDDIGFTLTLLNEGCHLTDKVYEEF